jgi:serine/threonine protein kinase
MPLSAGDKLGPYEILAPIGAGGMGEVYKARDARLDRIVAVKVSKTEFSERFEREARAVAALNHPHICQLYDVGPNYLVMEYIEGAPLKGPLPLDQTLKYAAQICDALDAAHKKNITHRDLKPANILRTKAGVKLLDFGLAKVGPVFKAEEATMTMALTGKGEILGPLLYMSPEQVNGEEAGPQSDIFSFGLVLYEMLTGERAFNGKSRASVVAAILEREAPSVADIAPPSLDRVLKRCLEKDPENRWQSARDLKAELEWITSTPEAGRVTPASLKMTSRLGRLSGVTAALLAVGFAAASWIAWRATRPVERPLQPLVRFDIDLGADVSLSAGPSAILSPTARGWCSYRKGGSSPGGWISSGPPSCREPRELPVPSSRPTASGSHSSPKTSSERFPWRAARRLPCAIRAPPSRAAVGARMATSWWPSPFLVLCRGFPPPGALLPP